MLLGGAPLPLPALQRPAGPDGLPALAPSPQAVESVLQTLAVHAHLWGAAKEHLAEVQRLRDAALKSLAAAAGGGGGDGDGDGSGGALDARMLSMELGGASSVTSGTDSALEEHEGRRGPAAVGGGGGEEEEGAAGAGALEEVMGGDGALGGKSVSSEEGGEGEGEQGGFARGAVHGTSPPHAGGLRVAPPEEQASHG